MHLSALFSALVGTLPPAKSNRPPLKLKPDTPVCMFIEKGHVIEYIEVGHERKRVVALFFGPQEFAIHCHLQYSNLQALDKMIVNPFTHGQIMHMLRKFPESHALYRDLRKIYQKKVADRIRTLTTMTGPERFAYLKEHQPWAFELAQPEDIASYLAIPMAMLEKLQKGSLPI